jgi:hypothetical protein
VSNKTQYEQLQDELRAQEAIQYSAPVEPPEPTPAPKPVKPFPSAPKAGTVNPTHVPPQ